MESSENTALIPNKNLEYKVYTKRWLVLTLYTLSFFSSTIQIPEYISIADTITKYYDVSITTVNWTVLIGSIEVVVITFPAITLIEKLGLRKTMLVSICGTAVASWIKVGGVDPTRFWAILLGQAFIGIFNFLLGNIPAYVAEKWFGAEEVSLACAIGLLTVPISLASAFLIPTSIVQSKSLKAVTNELYIINLIYAALPTVLIPFIFFFFNENPPTPPTKSQLIIKSQNLLSDLMRSLKNCVTNCSFILVTIIISVNTAYYIAITTVLNPKLMKYYPNSIAAVGYVGCVINISGVFGLILNGYLLDKFKQFKLTAWITVLLSFVTLTAFILFMDKGLHIVYIIASLYGFTFNGLTIVCVEMGIEFTHPEPVIAVSCIFNFVSLPLGVAFTYLYTKLILNHIELSVNIIIICFLFLMDALLILIKYDLKRQRDLA